MWYPSSSDKSGIALHPCSMRYLAGKRAGQVLELSGTQPARGPAWMVAGHACAFMPALLHGSGWARSGSVRRSEAGRTAANWVAVLLGRRWEAFAASSRHPRATRHRGYDTCCPSAPSFALSAATKLYLVRHLVVKHAADPQTSGNYSGSPNRFSCSIHLGFGAGGGSDGAAPVQRAPPAQPARPRRAGGIPSRSAAPGRRSGGGLLNGQAGLHRRVDQ